MLGRVYAKHLDILTQSFEQINKQYQKKIKTSKKPSVLVEKIKELYISIFGIPEIGFQIRSLYFEKVIKTYLVNKKLKNILDAGSGIGAYTFWLGKSFTASNVIGGEIDKDKLRSSRVIARELRPKNVVFTYMNITKKQNNALYDLIVCIDVLEHIEHTGQVLENFFRLLRKHGYIYIHVPQPNQKRIFSSLKEWDHEDHVHEGITKRDLENRFKKLGFNIVVSMETFGFFGKFAWEINHIMLSRSFVFTGITFPFLYFLASLDNLWGNKNGLGVAMLAKKN